MPAISVIVTVCNCEIFVREAIQSVLDQTFKDFELIIVDDGSEDQSVSACESFRDERIRILRQPRRGKAAARNTGIAAATGRYVALLDANDVWRSQKLMLHFIHLEASSDVDVSYAGSRLIDDKGRVLRIAMRPKLAGVTAGDILTRNPVGNRSAAVIRRSALDRLEFLRPIHGGRRCWFDETLPQSEEVELWLRLAAGHEGRFEGIGGLLTDYRVPCGGLSASLARQFESWQQVVAKVQTYAPWLITRHGKIARAYQLRYLARRALRLGDGPFATALIGQALRAHPAIMLAEPRKTLSTLAASFAARWLPNASLWNLMLRGSNVGAA